MERQTNPENNRMHELPGYGKYYRDSHASTALAIADALGLLLEKYDVQITKKEDEAICDGSTEQKTPDY